MTLILRTASRPLVALLLVFAVFVLLRGHNAPGGGFVGGLVAGAYGMAYGVPAARTALTIDPRNLIAFGLLISLASGLLAPLLGRPLLTGLWWEGPVPLFGKMALGTPLLFDIGVFLVVAGTSMTLLFALEEE
jgi:multicomponent Na+:H+ antiporter subunit B